MNRRELLKNAGVPAAAVGFSMAAAVKPCRSHAGLPCSSPTTRVTGNTEKMAKEVVRRGQGPSQGNGASF